MLRLHPLWRRRERLADWLPWLLPLDEARETILTAAGGLLRVARIEPPDFETASPEELVAHHARIAAAVARFGNGWSFWFDQWRTAASGYLAPCPFGGCLAAHADRREPAAALHRQCSAGVPQHRLFGGPLPAAAP